MSEVRPFGSDRRSRCPFPHSTGRSGEGEDLAHVRLFGDYGMGMGAMPGGMGMMGGGAGMGGYGMGMGGGMPWGY